MPELTAELLQNDYHKWKQGLTAKQIEEQLEFYRKRYKQSPESDAPIRPELPE